MNKDVASQPVLLCRDGRSPSPSPGRHCAQQGCYQIVAARLLLRLQNKPDCHLHHLSPRRHPSEGHQQDLSEKLRFFFPQLDGQATFNLFSEFLKASYNKSSLLCEHGSSLMQLLMDAGAAGNSLQLQEPNL